MTNTPIPEGNDLPLPLYSSPQTLQALCGGKRALRLQAIFLGGVTFGTELLSMDNEWSGGLREYARWGGNPIGGVDTYIAVFGSARDICNAQTQTHHESGTY